MKLTFKDIVRAGHVTRWHAVRTARQQTIAEHSFMVTMFAREIARKVYNEDIDSETLLLLINYSLDHDLPELVTGDIATTMKVRIREVAAANNIEDPIDLIEREIAPQIHQLSEKIKNTPLKYIVKLADIMDAKIFIEEEGIGSEAKVVSQRVSVMFDEKIHQAKTDFPDLNWDAARVILKDLINTG